MTTTAGGRRVHPIAVAQSTSPWHGSDEGRRSRIPVLLAMFGVSMFVVGGVLLVSSPGVLASSNLYGTPRGLALTHVFALGFVTSLIMAVLYQFVPASFHANVRGVRRTWCVVLAYPAAVLLFAVALGTGRPVLAAYAGPLLALAVAVFLSQMLDVVVRAQRRTLVSGFHLMAFASLAVVIVLGALLATSLPTAWIPDPQRWLSAKITIAVGGWLGMIFCGVSYHTVRGLNGSRARPRLVLPALLLAGGGVILTPLLILIGAPAALRVVTMAMLVAAAVCHAADITRLVLQRAESAVAVTWAGHLFSAMLLVATAIEGMMAMLGGTVWAAAAVSSFLLGVAPVAIVANGNRIIPVLIANRYRAGNAPLNSAGAGRFAIPGALAMLVLAWAAMQTGILSHTVPATRAAAILLLAAALCLMTTVVIRLVSAARSLAQVP